jgi:hypothetical protein
MTPSLAIRSLPVGGKVFYQLVDLRTLKTLRPLKEHEAEAMLSELIPVVRVLEPDQLRQ